MGASVNGKAHRKPVPMTSIVMSKAMRKKVGAIVGSSAALTMIASTSGASVADQIGSTNTVDVSAVTKDAAADAVNAMGVNDAVAAADVKWSASAAVAEAEVVEAPAVTVETPRRAPAARQATVQRATAQASQNHAPAAAQAAPAPKGGDAVGYARQFIGVPYVWGGMSPSGFDCSGLVGYVYRNSRGISLPRTAAGIGQGGTHISPSQAVPGDILYWPGQHVAIYAGGNNLIEASLPGTPIHEGPIWGNPIYVRY